MIYILGAALLFMILTSTVLIRNRLEFKSIDDLSLIQSDSFPKVSICVPARNEEDVIERCVLSLLNQDYSNFEILVLDDNSEDSTPSILQKLKLESESLIIIDGKPKPEDWLGKPWACHQLGEIASGDILIFVDSDVWLEPKVISKSVAKLDRVDAITIWPQQEVKSFLERLLVPTVYFALLTLLPAIYVERSPRWMPKFFRSFVDRKFVAACGQFFAFKKSAYRTIDGHKSVRKEVVEDMELARNLKLNGFVLSMSNGINSVYCRMYTSASDIWQGFQKNFLAGFGNLFEFIFMGVVHLLFFLYPFYSLILSIQNYDQRIIILSSSVILLYMFQRFILNLWFKWDWWMAFLHPLAVLWFQLLGIKTLFNRLFGLKSNWKGRQV